VSVNLLGFLLSHLFDSVIERAARRVDNALVSSSSLCALLRVRRRFVR
jgi:hypothetical protein